MESEPVPLTGRPNPFGFSPADLPSVVEKGRLHTIVYPVTVTGVLMPEAPIANLLKLPETNFLKQQFLKGFHLKHDVKNLDELFGWLGLNPFPQTTDKGIYSVPYPGGKRPDHRMGVTVTEKKGARGITFACASCHSGKLFGKTVLGLTTRFPRANEFFFRAKAAISKTPAFVFGLALGTTTAEEEMYAVTRENVGFVHSKLPQNLGLDTSLAHTALSLSRRAPDKFSSKDSYYLTHPSTEPLEYLNTDSKPMVWWNVKYKNRWLADGSVISGNPVYTNFIWNELGRGTDLNELSHWLGNHEDTVKELTTAIFSTQPPRYTDFFPAEILDLEKAKRGQLLFNDTCAKCHGNYIKAWSRPNAEKLSLVEKFRTDRFEYHKTTPVLDVGTDPTRYLGMVSLAPKLNQLELSQQSGVLVVPQQGYVPPPLEGIWARWPYFHNNSAPSLCAVLTRTNDRPKSYFAGEAIDSSKDFDSECNGYPLAEKVPPIWKEENESYFDSSKPGLSNHGHDEGIFLNNGKELYSHSEKTDIIEFLKTL